MKYVVIGARVILGLLFLVVGLDYFFHVLPVPEEQPDGQAGAFVGALFASGYLTVVKVLEAVGGALVLSGRFTPLGLLLLGPIVVNIVLFDVFLMKAFNPMGAAVAALSLFLLIIYRKNFAGIFSKPKV